jgi:tRNA(fMet)-specific endonuclease VapC
LSGYLLDTNILSDVIRSPDGPAARRIEQVGPKEIFTSIRVELEAAGQPIGMNDLLIAAHAYALGLTLVTDDTREFSRIRGLKVENWLEG